MTDPTRRRPGPRTWTALAVALAVVAAIALVVAITGQQRAPRPSATAATVERVAADTAPTPGTPAGPTAAEPTETVAAPVSVAIPSIDVRSDLLRLGVNDDGTVEVPPLTEDDQAGWYERGPAPGAVGPAVILGHVDSAEWGPGVFFDLGALQPGHEVSITREDGSVAVFVVDRVERHRKDDFPTIEVYGNTDDAQLRLITCGGDFDSAAGSYEDNVVAFATLRETRPA